MKPSSAKAKGRKHQQYVRDEILKRHPSLDNTDVRSTSMGAGGMDIQLSQAARKLVPLSIECKHRASYAFYKDWDQAVSNAAVGTAPVLVAKANHRPAVAILELETFLDILKQSNWNKPRRGTRK
jgi:hypothetical protein